MNDVAVRWCHTGSLLGEAVVRVPTACCIASSLDGRFSRVQEILKAAAMLLSRPPPPPPLLQKKRACSYRLNLLIEMRQVSQVSNEVIFGIFETRVVWLFIAAVGTLLWETPKALPVATQLLMRNARTTRWFTMSFCVETQSTAPSNAIVLNAKSVSADDLTEDADSFFPVALSTKENKTQSTVESTIT